MNRIEHTNDFYENKEFWTSVVGKNSQRSTFSDKSLDIRDNIYCNTTFIVNEDVSKKILSICNNSNMGIYIYMISAVLYILKFYTGNDDVFVGIERLTKSNISDLEVAIFKGIIDDDSTFKEFLMKSKEIFVKVNKFNKLNIREIQQLVGIEEFDNKTAIIDTMIRMKNLNLGQQFKNNNLSTIFEFEVKDSNIFCTIVYNINSVSETRIDNLKRHLMNFLTQVSNDYDKKIKDIEILEENEKNKILYDFNNTNVEYDSSLTIYELFEEQVKKTPNNVAVVFQDKMITYNELNEKSNSLARVLRRKGVKEDSIVGIMIDRSIEMIIGIMGILKSGGAYLPVDPNYPKERIEYM
uniref:AMP-binding protein n=1 Tax=Clostridium sp. UBA6640 TaxID=1946370 RepID=UPI0025C681EC